MSAHPTEDLAAFSIGALDPADASRVETHVVTCATCAAEVASFAEVAWGIAELAPLVAPGATLRARVLERSRTHTGPAERIAPRPAAAASLPGLLDGLRRVFDLCVPLAVPMALVLLLAVALAGLVSARTDADAYARAVAGVADGTVVTLAATPGAEARGSLVVPVTGDPYLILRLPAPPAGKTWEAWVLRGQQPLAAGISGDRSGVVTLVLSQPIRPGDGVAVTLEDAGGVQAPRGAVVLQGRI